MTATEEVKKPSVKRNSLLALKGFLSGPLKDGCINQEDFDYVLKKRRSIEDRDTHVPHYIADLKVEDRKSQDRKLDIESLTMALSTQGDLGTLRNQTYKEGVLSLRLSGAQKVAAGITTVKEILRVTPDNID
tara:strand:- start:141 stop:536 length:396 start_codon:yes stop_codon:yes gene_type:complete